MSPIPPDAKTSHFFSSSYARATLWLKQRWEDAPFSPGHILSQKSMVLHQTQPLSHRRAAPASALVLGTILLSPLSSLPPTLHHHHTLHTMTFSLLQPKIYACMQINSKTAADFSPLQQYTGHGQAGLDSGSAHSGGTDHSLTITAIM